MPHPFESLLKEYKVAIDHLGPTVPEAVAKEAGQMYADFIANEEAEEKEIISSMSKVGRKEFPHRNAYVEVAKLKAKSLQVEMVLEHVEDNVRVKMEKYISSGVALEEFVASKAFETELTAEERYQVEHGILDAIDHVKEEAERSASELASSPEYVEALKKWEGEAVKIDEKILELEGLREKDEKWREEIEGKVSRFREGFLLTERDPDLLEIEKEIEYWRGTLGEEV